MAHLTAVIVAALWDCMCSYDILTVPVFQQSHDLLLSMLAPDGKPAVKVVGLCVTLRH